MNSDRSQSVQLNYRGDMNRPPQLLGAAGEKFALVIGIDTYRDSTIPPLMYARNDAMAIHDFLTDPQLGKFKKENVHLLLDGNATLGDIRSQFVYWLGGNASERDLVWVFFAGYGSALVEPAAGAAHPARLYLLAHDSLKHDLATSAISAKELKEWLDLIAAPRVVMFLDCGFSSDGSGRTIQLDNPPALVEDTLLTDLSKDKQRVIIAAAGANEVCLENSESQHGLFSRYLIHCLQSIAGTDNRALLTLKNTSEYVADQVSRYAATLNAIQNPVVLGNPQDDFPLLDFEAPTARRSETAGEAQPQEKAQALLQKAQKEVDLGNFHNARDLLQELLEIDPGNQRAQSGMKKIDEYLERHDRERQIEELFKQARRSFDDRSYDTALMCYERILELDPSNTSAALGAQSCQELLQKGMSRQRTNGQVSGRSFARPSHHLKPFDRYIWPFVGWWSLVGCIWGIFGAPRDAEVTSSIVVVIFEWGVIGVVVGLIHGTLAYLVKRLTVKVRPHSTRHS